MDLDRVQDLNTWPSMSLFHSAGETEDMNDYNKDDEIYTLHRKNHLARATHPA